MKGARTPGLARALVFPAPLHDVSRSTPCVDRDRGRALTTPRICTNSYGQRCRVPEDGVGTSQRGSTMHRLTLLAALLCPGIATATGCTPPATLDQRQNSGRWTLQPQARKPTPVKWRHDRSQSPLRCNGIRPRADQRSAPTIIRSTIRSRFQQIAATCRRRGGSGCGGVSAMDGATEPPWVRALCLRSTASQAPERTAASGWAGPRRGIYGVPRNRTHPATPRIARF